MKKLILGTLSLVLLVGCGFEPLYVQKKHDNAWYFNGEFDTSISSEMSQIKVEAIAERFGQIVRNELIDSLTPRGVPAIPAPWARSKGIPAIHQAKAARRPLSSPSTAPITP